MNRNIIIGAIIILIVVIGYVVYANRNANPVTTENIPEETSDQFTEDQDTNALNDTTMDEETTEPVTSLQPTVSPVTSSTGSVKEFTITGSNFKFAPSEMRVKQGDTVKITFQNQSGTHNLKIDEFNVGTKMLQTGQQETIQFVADKTGQFEYYCSVGNHRQMGMKGTLIVE